MPAAVPAGAAMRHFGNVRPGTAGPLLDRMSRFP